MLGFPVESVNEWANRAYILFTIIAVAGAALALIASFFMWRTGAILSRISDEKIAALADDAAKARLEQQKLSSANLKLEAQIQPRRFNSIDGRQINILKPFAGQTVLIKSYQMDADAAILGSQIIEIFRQIGLKAIDRRMTDGSIGGIAFGVLVSGSNKALRDAIVEVFNQVGLRSAVGSPPPAAGMFVGDPNETGDVNIFIGVKPPA